MNVKVDEAAWGALPNLRFMQDGDEYVFMIRGESPVIAAKVVDGNLDLVPERSVLHRKLVAALGIAL
jgi:hypothetical protein